MRYNKASASVATLVEQGAHLVTALQNFSGPERRSEVTDALGELEAARHRVRPGDVRLGQGTRVKRQRFGPSPQHIAPARLSPGN